jgi:branched-chain amino acid transport system ATP-binding protein
MVGAIFGRRQASESQAEEEALRQLTILELAEKQDLKASALNHMELKKMEIARALATSPRLLLLDEPAAGLTPTEVNWLIETIRKTNKSGITIMMIEHILRAVMSLSDRIVVLNHGDLLAEGTPQQIAQNEQVVQAYLGEKHVATA